MDTEEPLTRAQGQALLEYAQLTFEAVTSYRRRGAKLALGMAVIIGLLCLFSAAQWLSTRNKIDDVPDDSLIEALGVEIPDPRPALERGQLRVIAALWGFVTASTAGLTVLFLAVFLMVRPPRGPERGRPVIGRDP